MKNKLDFLMTCFEEIEEVKMNLPAAIIRFEDKGGMYQNTLYTHRLWITDLSYLVKYCGIHRFQIEITADYTADDGHITDEWNTHLFQVRVDVYYFKRSGH